MQLCVLRTHGRFLDDYRHAPIKTVNHLSRQLGLAPVLFLDRPGRAQTERTQALRIRRHLGLRGFDRQVAADLREWLRQGAIEGRTADLRVRAEDRLRDWRVMLPAANTLERLVAAEVKHATTRLYETVTGRLPVHRPRVRWDIFDGLSRADGGAEMDDAEPGGAAAVEVSRAGAGAARGRERRMTAGCKRDAVLRLVRGEPLEIVARELSVTAADLGGWRDAFLEAGEASLKDAGARRPRRDHRPAAHQGGRADDGRRAARGQGLSPARPGIGRLEAGGAGAPFAPRTPAR